MGARTKAARSAVHSSGGRIRRQPRYPDARAGGFASLPRDSFADDNVRCVRRLARNVGYMMWTGRGGVNGRPPDGRPPLDRTPAP